MNTTLAVDPALRITLRAALSLLFFWAAAHKLRDVTGFRAALAAYELLPQRCVEAAAGLLIVAEVAIGGGLLVPAVATGAALTAASLLGVYAAAIAINLLRGRRHIDCGCVGAAARRPLSSVLVARNGVLVVVALASALPATSRSFTVIDGVTIVAGVATLALLYAAIDGLIANAPGIAALARARAPHDLAETNRRQVNHA